MSFPSGCAAGEGEDMRHAFRIGSPTPERYRIGPLGPYIDPLAVRLSEFQYARETARHKIRVVADLSRWLERRRGAERIEGRVGLWMEFVRGQTLEDVLGTQGPLSARDATSIGIDLCFALAAVHGAGIIHRDIKAHNVMKEEGGRIVLMDFGAGLDLEKNEPAGTSMTGT